MRVGDTIAVTIDYGFARRRGKRKAQTAGHYSGPAVVLAIDEYPLDAEPLYRVHPTGSAWQRYGDVYVFSSEVCSGS